MHTNDLAVLFNLENSGGGRCSVGRADLLVISDCLPTEIQKADLVNRLRKDMEKQNLVIWKNYPERNIFNTNAIRTAFMNELAGSNVYGVKSLEIKSV